MLAETDFSIFEDRMLFLSLRQVIYAGLFTAVEDLVDQLDAPLQERLDFLTSQDGQQRFLSTPDTADSLVLSVLHCRGERIRQQLSSVKQLLEQSDKQRNPDLLAAYDQQLGQDLLRINKAKAAMMAVNRRRAAEKRL